MSMNWEKLYARRLEWMSTSVIRDILKVAQADDVISMAGGWPEADLFPVDQFAEICDQVLREMPRESLQYGITDGLTLLRETLADTMTEMGVPCGAENIAITSGSQQALDLMGRIFCDEGDTVLIESPTFLGALQSFNAYGVQYAAVPVDDDGVLVDELEKAVAETSPKFMYLLPTFQNPTGVTMSLERRVRVIEIAEAANVPILEDDPYGQLRFAGEPLPSLLQLSAERHPGNAAAGRYVDGSVIYLSSFSKTLAPGLRLAWAVAPPEIAQQFVMAKQGSDLHTNALSQTIAYSFMQRGWLPAQIQRIRDTYLARRNAMCAAIEKYFPQEGVHYTRPDGGLFMWVDLPDCIDTVAMLADAAAQKVAYVPGMPFFVDGSGRSTLRLSFASVPPDIIEEGIKRLGAVIEQHMCEAD